MRIHEAILAVRNFRMNTRRPGPPMFTCCGPERGMPIRHTGWFPKKVLGLSK
jgi:hypothetical protein